MKARSIWPAAFVVFFGCGTGTGAGTDPSGGGLSAGSTLDQSITRISPAEYATAVNNLFGIPPSAQPVAVVDSTALGFARTAGAADDAALADYDAAFAVATMATSAAHMSTLLQGAGCTAPEGNSGSVGAACAAAFVREVAPLAFSSGPVDAPTLAGLNDLYTTVAVTQGAGFSGGLAAVVEEVLQSPYFLYRGWSG
jgi:hypothetical protein